MDAARWKQVRELMERVLDQPRPARDMFLEEACAGDSDLQREVVSLIAALDEAGSFIEQPAVDLGAPTPPEAPPETPLLAAGASLGRFVILDVVGQGGMGVVYAAYDPQLDRRVALKLLRAQTVGDGAMQERLLREAQALARLAHPNVITVFDAGSVDGRVFIAMEFVSGQTLKAWLDAEKRSWRDVRAVFVPAGRGLEAAHAAGLVHRDFKPGNVIVGRERVVVVDFGLARRHDDPGAGAAPDPRPTDISATLERTITHTGTLMGTPAYMAPEQYRGSGASAAADQYSFCVSLYEALYGQRPFQGDGHTLREPPPGSGVPAWLHRIVARGLRRDPAERFPSMGALLAALSYDPRAARVRLAVGAAVLAMIAGGVIGLHYLARRDAALCAGVEARLSGIWDDGRRRALDQAFAATGASFAEDARKGTRAALDTYAREWARLRLDACEATHVRREQSPELLDRRMACLDERLDELGALVEQLTQADAARVESATKTASGLPPLARCADTSALMAVVRPPTDDATRAKVEDVRRRLARARAAEELGEYDRGLELAATAVPEAEKIAYWPLTAEALLRLAALQEAKVKPDDATAALQRALLAAQAGRHDRVAVEAFARLVRVAGSLKSDREGGHRYAAHARALLEQLRARDDLEALLATNVGKLWFDQGDYKSALDHYARAFDLRQAALGPQHPQVADMLALIGHVHLARGANQDALVKFEEALRVNEASLGPAHPKVAVALDETGRVLFSLGDPRAALDRHQRALALLEAAAGPEDRRLAIVLVNLGNAWNAVGDARAALAAHERARAVLEHTLGPNHPRVAVALIGIGNVHLDAREYRAALAPYRRALALQEAAYGPRHPSVASTLFNLGEVHNRLHEPAKALDHYRRAMAIWDQVFGRDHYLHAYGLTGVGEALLQQGRAVEARAALERAVEISGNVAVRPRARGLAEFGLARALRESGRGREEARAMAVQARGTLAMAGPAAERDRRDVDAWLKRFYSGGR